MKRNHRRPVDRLAAVGAFALLLLLAPSTARAVNVQLRLIRATPSGSVDGRLSDVGPSLKSRGFRGAQLLGESTVGVAQGATVQVGLPEGTKVSVRNERESGGRTTLRVGPQGWGAAVTLKDHPRNKPALIVGPQRGGGRLVLAVRPR